MVDRRETDELAFDGAEEFEEPIRFEVATARHRVRVAQVLLEAPLDLGENLPIEIVVKKRHEAVLGDEDAARFLPGQLWHEVCGTGEFDIQA